MNQKRLIFIGLGVALGAAAGFGYWYFWGCTEGCAITSSPIRSTLYGMVMGGLALDLNHTRKPQP
jgi:hypothetical protein